LDGAEVDYLILGRIDLNDDTHEDILLEMTYHHKFSNPSNKVRHGWRGGAVPVAPAALHKFGVCEACTFCESLPLLTLFKNGRKNGSISKTVFSQIVL